MISVVIPVLNESETVRAVIEFARGNPLVGEVIVVDDGSIDGTPELAVSAGATVITSTLLGKGASMEDGLHAARNEILLYLDGDLTGLHEDLIERMARPLLEERADFVKAAFSRSAGRVTTLTARPLLRSFFPELTEFRQPLGGIISARRSLLQRLSFETDYGVDVGLIIDAAMAGARLAEADIGHVAHDSHPLEILGDMAMEVVRTILAKAIRYGRFQAAFVREVQEVERRMEAELSVVLQKVGHMERLALFDMDGVLLDGRFVVRLAQKVDRTSELAAFLDHAELTPDERSRQIASLFAGVPREVIEQTAREAPLMPGAAETVVSLRKAGFRVGIVTDSYRVAAEIVRRRVFADFSIAHLLRFRRGAATGRVTLSPAMVHPRGCPEHAHCKRNVMLHLMEKMGIQPEQVFAIGDSDPDACLLRAAGESVAFHPKSDAVRQAARHVVEGPLSDVVKIACR
jgi:glucosyl-3-phosphoglycerate synthase